MTYTNLATVAMIALALTACGSDSGDDSDPKDALIGKWSADVPGSPGCIFGGAFDANGVYESDIVCPLADGSYGAEAEVGSYGANGSTLDFVPTKASCLQADRDHNPSSVSYAVSKTTLRLVFPSGAVVFEKIDNDPHSLGTSSIVAHYGCANADGFVYSDVVPL